MSGLLNGLSVPVLSGPHWRVNFIPDEYVQEAIPSLEECLKIVGANRVRLGGWDYPHLGNAVEVERGANYIASGTDFAGNCEYWRFYQSGQFIHLFAVREVGDKEWLEDLRKVSTDHIIERRVDGNQVPGFISITHFIHCVAEIFEFAARLCQSGVYRGNLAVSIDLKGIKGFLLTTERDRVFPHYCPATVDILGRTWTISSQDLLADSTGKAVVAAAWFFERFGWRNAPVEDLRKDIARFLGSG
jgi:hypothetical protein